MGAALEQAEIYSTSNRERLRVLLLDDDTTDCDYIKKISMSSKQVDLFYTSCRSTDEARRALEKNIYDIAFVDYWLGSETSMAFIQDISKEFNLPSVLLTGLDAPEIRVCGFRSGSLGFLSKGNLSIQAVESVVLTVLQCKKRLGH